MLASSRRVNVFLNVLLHLWGFWSLLVLDLENELLLGVVVMSCGKKGRNLLLVLCIASLK